MISPDVGASTKDFHLRVTQQVTLAIKWHFQCVPAGGVRLLIRMIHSRQLLSRLHPLQQRRSRRLSTAGSYNVSDNGGWWQGFAVIGVKTFGKAWQWGGRTLWRNRLGGGWGGVAGQWWGGDVAGGFPAAHLVVALCAKFGAQAEGDGANVCGRRTGRTGARRCALRRVIF